MAVTMMLLCESTQQIAVQKLMIEKVPKTKSVLKPQEFAIYKLPNVTEGIEC